MIVLLLVAFCAVVVALCALVVGFVALGRQAEAGFEHEQARKILERHLLGLEREVRELRETAGRPAQPAEPRPVTPVAQVEVGRAAAAPTQPAPPPLPARAERADTSQAATSLPERRDASRATSGLAASPVAPSPAIARDQRPTTPDQRPTTNNQRPYVDWETLVGVKLFSWIAAIALALGAVFFLRYSIQAGWLQPPIRMAIGIVVGLALLSGCEMKVARNYPVTANALDASGIVILFSTFFAAFALWQLIGVGAAFLLLILVTAVAVLLSIRRDSLFIAILGLIGGFLTPALLSTGQDHPFGLFGYLLVLNAGLAWVAYRKRWSLLTVASLVLTTAYQWSWVAKFLTEANLPLAAGIFLAFPILAFVALALGRGARSQPQDGTFALTASASGVLPLLFAAYLASVPAYAAHAALMFGFLLCVDAGLLAIAIGARGFFPAASNAHAAPPANAQAARRAPDLARRAGNSPELLHLAGGIATNAIFLCYLTRSYSSAAWPAVLGPVALFVLLYLGSPLVARWLHRPFAGAGSYAGYAGAALLFAFPLLVALEPATGSPARLFAVLFVLAGVASAVALVERQGSVHFVAAFFALVAEAVWSARFLDDARLLPALAVYLVFALFYIGVPVLARRLGRALQPPGAAGVILLVSLALLFFPAGLLATDSALWGLSLLLAILNVATFVEGAAVRRPVLSFISTLISWTVICAWWARAGATSLTGPGLLVVAAFAMLTLGGHIWNARRGDRDDPVVQNGVFLGLTGHLFLLFVAGQPALSIPPWPMLAVLFVLDLAIGVSALYTRRAILHLAMIGVSAMVLLAWQSHAVAAPWPATAVVAGGGLALLAATWMWLARRPQAGEDFLVTLDAGGALAFLLALVVSVFASGAVGAPSPAFIILAHVVLLGGLLAVAALRRWHVLAVVAVVPYALTVIAWQSAHDDPASWLPLLLIAGSVYAVFLAYPLLLGRRAGRATAPYLGAVLASAVFFFAARHSLVDGGFADVIGVLPVGQAVLMAVLLVDLLRLEPAGERATGRLALVAGTALAFITVAIPLQLDKEWITIGWALEGAALAWLYRNIPHRGLLIASAGLLAAVFVRLAFNPAVLVYQARGPYRIWNWYLYTYLVSAAALLSATRLFRGTDDRLLGHAPGLHARPLVASFGTVLLFLLLNIEIADFYSVGPSITFTLGRTLAEDMTYTLGWGVFAVGLLVAGIVVRSRPARFAALMLLVVTVLKGFLHDLARLGGLYRVASFVGLAICLALVAVMLQKFVLRPRGGEVHEPIR